MQGQRNWTTHPDIDWYNPQHHYGWENVVKIGKTSSVGPEARADAFLNRQGHGRGTGNLRGKKLPVSHFIWWFAPDKPLQTQSIP
ncbi:hypothetical protein Q8G50_32990, partial [Klebsiella pneumoniae]